MSNALPPSTQESDELDLSNLLGDMGGDFDIFMTTRQLDIPATAQNSLEVPIAAIRSQRDEDSARCDDFTTVYDGCNQSASGTTNPTAASVVDPLLLSKYLGFRATHTYWTNMITSGRICDSRLGMRLASNPRTTLAHRSGAHIAEANVIS